MKSIKEKIKEVDNRLSRKNGVARAKEFDRIIPDSFLVKEYAVKQKTTPKLGKEIGVTSQYLCKRLHKLDIIRDKTKRHLGKFNARWQNTNPSYAAVHAWVRRHYGKSKYCEICNTALAIDLANISGQYLRDRNDYKWLCRNCHMEEDGRKERLRQRIIMQNKNPMFILKRRKTLANLA